MRATMPKIAKIEIKLVREPRTKYPIHTMRSPEDAANWLAFLKDSDREQFVVLLLNTNHEVIGYNVVSIGTLNASLVHMREVFKPAILCNAHAIMCAHNHPTGKTFPSNEDIEITKQLIEAGKLLGIKVLDHIIIGDGFRSMRDKWDVDGW